ncbi:hypothetical protein TNCV_4249261 [Trichonephila clavipes]|nr:hypothetical protein TNCV_4249261 [Trichonephila clavipes]
MIPGLFGNYTLRVSRQTDHLTVTSAHAPQRPRSRILRWVQWAWVLMSCCTTEYSLENLYYGIFQKSIYDICEGGGKHHRFFGISNGLLFRSVWIRLIPRISVGVPARGRGVCSRQAGGRRDVRGIPRAWLEKMRLSAHHPTDLWGSPVVKVSDYGRHVLRSSPVPLKTRRVGE